MATQTPDPDRNRNHRRLPLSTPEDILGASPAAEAIRAFARRAGAVDAPVLLTGESGTGKGLLAGVIHALSRRSRAPFISVNCAGVPDSLFESEFFGHTRGAFTGAQQAHRGLLEQAHAGTLFLDEVGELAVAFQAKLLTAIEERQFRRVGGERSVTVDFRLIAATSADLDIGVTDGRFRRDLYHRLMVLAFRLPALRERGHDVEGFIDAYLERFAARYERRIEGIDDRARTRLGAYGWPGNVRELAHAIEAAVLTCEGRWITVEHLPASVAGLRAVRPPTAPDDPTRTTVDARSPGERYSFYGSAAQERLRIEAALRRWRGNKTRAAAELGMARNTLRARLRTLAPIDDAGEGEPASSGPGP